MIRRRVLVVEDERLLAQAVCEVLGDDHDVEHAATVAHARRLIEELAFDVLLCDVTLPDGTAADVCDAWPRERARHVVLVTGGATGNHGGFRVIAKPFDILTLATLIDQVAAL